MNMSIKACVPHHASSQKHLLSLLPRPAARACPRPGRGYQSLLLWPLSHLQARASWDKKPQVPSWLWQHPSKREGRPAGLSLTTLPQGPGFRQTRRLCSPQSWAGAQAGLVWRLWAAFPLPTGTEQAGAGAGTFHLCPAAHTHLSQHGISAHAGQCCPRRAVPYQILIKHRGLPLSSAPSPQPWRRGWQDGEIGRAYV